MSRNSELEPVIRDILHVINPSRDDWLVRFRVIDELRAVVQSMEILRGATVEPYGSFVSNLFTRWGDLDISIEIPNGLYISSAGKKRKVTLLGELLRALRRKGGCHKLMFIANARVPILKFESNHQNISCDISINNLNGQMKSKLLFWINEIDGRFRDMVLLVKVWAKARGINDSKNGTFNSYTISLLIIFHFQTCAPAILPPLKELYPGNMVDDLTGVRADAEKHIEETCAANIRRFKEDRSRRVNRRPLTDLFVEFLAKFCDLSLRAPEQGICTYTGQWEDIESNTRWLPKTFALFVEDPFEQPANSARTVGSNQMAKISEAFRATYQLLISSSNQSRSALLAALASPQVSFLVARTSLSNLASDYGGGGYPTHTPSPSQPQFHNPRQQQHMISNNVTHTPSPSQLQFHNPRQRQRSPQGYYAPHHQQHRNPNNDIMQSPPLASHTRQHRNPNSVIAHRPVYLQHRNPNNVTAQRLVQASTIQPQQKWKPRSDQ